MKLLNVTLVVMCILLGVLVFLDINRPNEKPNELETRLTQIERFVETLTDSLSTSVDNVDKVLVIIKSMQEQITKLQAPDFNSTPLYGKGDLPADYLKYFGNCNMARLNYMQTERLNKMGQAVAVLAERVRKLEVVEVADPNGGVK